MTKRNYLETLANNLKKQIIPIHFYNEHNNLCTYSSSRIPKYTFVKSRVEKVIDEMSAEGKVQNLSKKATFEIDQKIGEAVHKARKEFELKEKNSRAYIAEIELKTRSC